MPFDRTGIATDPIHKIKSFIVYSEMFFVIVSFPSSRRLWFPKIKIHILSVLLTL